MIAVIVTALWFEHDSLGSDPRIDVSMEYADWKLDVLDGGDCQDDPPLRKNLQS